MVQQLSDNRDQLGSDQGAELQGFADFVAENRSNMDANLAKMKANLVASGA
jgi:hypothetical protein